MYYLSFNQTKPIVILKVNEGKRKFLVADIKSFSKKYSEVEVEKRHLYEIIRENFPCRLYFDLEFSVADNPNLDG